MGEAVYPRMCNKASCEAEGACLGPGRGQGSAVPRLPHFNRGLKKCLRILIFEPRDSDCNKGNSFQCKNKTLS